MSSEYVSHIDDNLSVAEALRAEAQELAVEKHYLRYYSVTPCCAPAGIGVLSIMWHVALKTVIGS